VTVAVPFSDWYLLKSALVSMPFKLGKEKRIAVSRD